jgi:hypothetical protein
VPGRDDGDDGDDGDDEDISRTNRGTAVMEFRVWLMWRNRGELEPEPVLEQTRPQCNL